jgi:prepilin-type N-terminal cleavage/methylation domain-containing protein
MARGFTLIELAVVLVVAGFLLAVGLASWTTVVEVRRIAKAKSQLLQMRDCLLQASLRHEYYPSDADVARCQDHTGPDPWGTQIRFVRGRNPSNTLLDANFTAVTDLARGQTMTLPSSTITLTTPEGNRTSIAFALVSLGKDKQADHTTYSSLTNTTLPVPITNGMDFSNPADDLVLVVQGYEVTGYIRNVVGPQ